MPWPLLLTLVLSLLGDPKIDEICRRFSGFDQDADGRVEIAEVAPLERAGESGRRVVVLVEDRLLRGEEGAEDLRPRVARLIGDLASEGRRACALRVALAPGGGHRDGRYLLALRELLRAIARDDDLEGVVLVGRFPDALVVRTVNWRKRGDLVLRKGRPDEARHRDVRYLRRVPEDVAHRADLVLADLDGRWEDVYVEGPTRLETVHAVFAGEIPERGGDCVDLERGGVEFRDFFLVSDGKLEVRDRLDESGKVVGRAVLLDDRAADHECSDADRERPNAIARAEITVSRIDARGSAWRPRADLRDFQGDGLLDESGRPRMVVISNAGARPDGKAGIWEPDPILERRLLAEFLDRDHGYRRGDLAIARRPASVACDLPSGYREMAKAAKEWEDVDPAQDDRAGRATIADVAAWLRRPAILRTIRAHSDPWGSVFAPVPPETLGEIAGGPAWSWTQRNEILTPDLQGATGGGKADWFLFRTLWENGRVAPEPSFYLHTGCEGISPPNWRRLAHDDPLYGRRQGGEALLFFGRGLALVGRAKVFYDEPRGFAEALAAGATVGEAWARYGEIESKAASWSKVGGDIGRKRSYFWSVLGDATLRLRR
ncbi:MAG: hypothetical protein R3F20_02520 [Planctomycetota bacterium]